MKVKREYQVKEYNFGIRRRDFTADIPEDKDFTINTLLSFRDATLLIVEDNAINLKVLLKVLEHSNISIKTAGNGQEAIEVLSKLNPEDLDLILMDINMPIMDGYKATTLIRQDSKWQDLPIVALSALNLEQEIRKMSEVGMDAFLPKPLNLKQLSTIFKKYLKDNYKEQKSTLKKIDLSGYNYKDLDLKDALESMGGDLDILKETLSQFRNDYRYSARKIEFYIKVDDFKMLQKILIDLVGLSGSIGSKKLYEASKALYKDFIFSRFNDIVSKLPEYNMLLNSVCDSIDNFLDEIS